MKTLCRFYGQVYRKSQGVGEKVLKIEKAEFKREENFLCFSITAYLKSCRTGKV